MKKQIILRGLTIGVCVLTLTGCSTRADGRTGEKDVLVTEQHQNNVSDTEDISLNEDKKDNIAPEKDNIVPEADDVNGNGNKEEPLPNEGAESASNGADASTENQNNTTANDTGEKVDADSLYASAAMTGSVVDFSDDSCTVSAAVTEDDGKTGVIAAPGYENEDTNVVVTYQEGCVVQIATIYTSTGIAELEQASVDDIKKQASVIIYGSFEDTHHVSATKIIICHRTA